MKPTLKTIIWATVAAFILNLFFGRFLVANISTWPILNKFKLLSPQTPIVINNREEIRLTDSGQVSDAVNAVKSKISSLILKDLSGSHMLGSAINLTSDGVFVSVKQIIPAKGELWLILSDQRTVQIKQTVLDPASGLVFLKADINNVPTAPLADSKSFLSGEKLVYFSNNTDESWQAWPDYLVRQENDRDESLVYAGKVSRSLELANLTQRAKGKVVLNIKGEVAGLVSENAIIPSDVIKSSLNFYISEQQKISRPDFEFSYLENLFIPLASQSTLPQGPTVTSSVKNSPIKTGDIIIEAGGQILNKNIFLEEVLEKFKPGDSVIFKINRAGVMLDITIKAKELK